MEIKLVKGHSVKAIKAITKNKQESKLAKIVIWSVLLFMPLSTYITPIPGVTVGDVLIIAVFIWIIIDILLKNHDLMQIVSLPLFIYGNLIIIHSLIMWILNPVAFKEGILGVSRYLLYIMFAAIGARYYFDFEYAYTIYKRLSIVFAIYCIMQFFSFNFFSIILPANLFGLPSFDYITAIDSQYNMGLYLSKTVAYRPRSVFLEPAYYAAYQIPILYFILNSKREKFKNKYIIGMIITLSVLLSGTLTGILLLVFCWWKPILRELKKLSLKFIALVLAITPATLYLLKSDYIQGILRRLISLEGGMGISVRNRTNNYGLLLNGQSEWLDILLGRGMWTDLGYLPSYGTLFLYFGIIGFLLFILMMLWSYYKCGKEGRNIIILMLIMLTATNTLFEITSVLMFFLIYSHYDKKINSKVGL